jgi:iron complex transport system substrate-binding protein
MKKKTLVLIGIAVCAILLTSPVLASSGHSKIYGNANEDDVLDMRDVTYIKLVIFGKKPATTFADANYDGKISMLDVGQTKLIILGKEKLLTLIDQADRTVTVPRPIERVVSPCLDGIRTIVSLSEVDKLVGVASCVPNYEGEYLLVAFPELKELPLMGDFGNLNMELIVALKPDVIFASAGYTEAINALQESTGIPVVCLGGSSSWTKLGDFEIFRLVGTVIGKEKEADGLISYFNEKIAGLTEVTSQIPDSEKPKVYLAFWTFQGTITRTPVRYDPVDLAGGINVAKEAAAGAGGYAIDVSKEQIIKWNPDVILMHGKHGKKGMDKEEVLSDPDLQTVNAVKNHRVNHTKGFMMGWDPVTGLTEVFYMAKLFYPEEFKDLDVEKECDEILEKAYGVDGLYITLIKARDLYTWKYP